MTLGTTTSTQWTQNVSGYSASIAVKGGTGIYSNPSATGLPPGLNATLSGSAIAISGTPTQTGPFTISLSVQDSLGHKATYSFVLTISAPPNLGALSPAQWTANKATTGKITFTGGTTGLALKVSGLPAGLSASFSGNTIIITGTTPTAGTYTVSVLFQDSAGDTWGYPGGPYTLIVVPASSLTVTPSTPSPAMASVSQSFRVTFAATGGFGSYVYSLAKGSKPLPPGLTLSSSGVLSGTPTVAGPYSFTIQANDPLGTETGICNYTINVTRLR